MSEHSMSEHSTSEHSVIEHGPSALGLHERTARNEIVRVGRALSAAGLSPGATGNISALVGEKIICTSTGVSLAQLDADELSVINRVGEHIGGNKPTKETFIHAAMYRADLAIAAVIHLHSSYATALSCLSDLDPDDALVPMTPYLTMRAGAVCVIPYFAPGSTNIAQAIGDRAAHGSRVMLLANHGSLIAAGSVAEATTIAHELEEAAKLFFLTRGLAVNHLTGQQIAELIT